MKKTLLLVFILSVSLEAYAQTVGDTFVFNFITYEITSLSPNRVKVTDYNPSGGTDVVIPNSVTPNSSGRVSSNTNNRMMTYTVTGIGVSAFQNNGLTSIFIPPNVTTIDDVAFATNQLTSITIPNSVTTIGDAAFSTNQLTSIVLGSGLMSIGGNAFDINPTLTCVGSNATTPPTIFTGNGDSFGVASRPNMSLIFPTGSANAYQTQWLNFGAYIDGYVVGNSFWSDYIQYQITSITPSTVKVTGYNTNGGTAVTIPPTVVASCTSDVFTVTEIGLAAFNSINLSSVILPDTVLTIDLAAFSNTGISSVTLSNALVSIGEQSFQNNNLSSIAFPSSLETIGNYAFGNNQFNDITIPENVISIGDGVFRLNPLNSVTSLAQIPPQITTGGVDDTFAADRSTIALTIPTGTEGPYVNDPGAQWINFMSVVLNTSDFELDNGIKVISKSDRLEVKYSSAVQLQQYTLYTLSGATLQQGTDTEISTASYAAGIYILKLAFDQGSMTKKVLIN